MYVASTYPQHPASAQAQAAAGLGNTPLKGGMTFEYLGGLGGPRQPRAAEACRQPEHQLTESTHHWYRMVPNRGQASSN